MGCVNNKNQTKDSTPRSKKQNGNKSNQNTETYKLKILLLGDLGVGKTR
jgi:GTPase SAR1 family protein